VTVGSHYQGFERLVKKMDEIAGRIDEEVVMQIGHTDYKPVNARFFDFLESFEEIERLNREARVVVSHAGAGSILTALEQKSSVIVVPRLRNYSEHMDDHQLEIAEAMSENQRVKAVYDVDELEDCLQSDLSFVDERNENRLVDSVKDYLSSIS
jgi:UDP-N-acetylglucosamine transferase subunit ALG13